MRKALIVGIDDYPIQPLTGSVTDATTVNTVLTANGDGSPNFDCVLMTSDVTRPSLRSALEKLFQDDSDFALFYFSGHGTITSSGGIIVTQDAERHDEGITMDDLMNYVNQSRAKNKLIILDCCNSGNLGSLQISQGAISQLKNGTTILTASRDWEDAIEIKGEGGIFTNLLVEALQGGAADIKGNITPGSLYAYIDEALGAWAQRPLFKTNISHSAVIRTVQPLVELSALRRIAEYFPTPTSEHALDPSYEPERGGSEGPDMPAPDPTKNKIFAELQQMNRVGLVKPIDAPHMWHAARDSKSCGLTALGKQYWRLAKERKI